MKYHMYSDAGHGWLRVSISKLEKLCIANLISEYSYMRYDVAFLEEDADLTLFCNAMKAFDSAWKLDENVKEHSTNKTSPIRNYDAYIYETYLQIKALILRFDSDEIYREQIWRVVIAESKSNADTTVRWNNLRWIDVAIKGKNWIVHLLPRLDELIAKDEENRDILLKQGGIPEKSSLNKITTIVSDV
mgnify:CR=1 FL=1|jgi:hypothetical protein